MCFKEFLKVVEKCSNNPLGILSIFTITSLFILYIFTSNPNVNNFQTVSVVSFLMIVLFTYYNLVTKHTNKLYAPSDFQNDENFLKWTKKVNDLETVMEEVQKAIYEQPLYKYTKLSEEGKRLILRVYHEKVDLDDFLKKTSFNLEIINEQILILESYDWIIKEKNLIEITEKGKDELYTFEDLVYGRLC